MKSQGLHKCGTSYRDQWRIQTFADGGANRDLSDNAVLPQHIVLWIANKCKAILTYNPWLIKENTLSIMCRGKFFWNLIEL